MILRVTVIVIVLGLAVWGFIYWESRGHAPAVVQGAPPQAVEVHVVEVSARNVPVTPVFLGVTEPSHQVEIRVRVNGFIEERAFDEGSNVEAGQLLYRLDARPFEAALAVARARVENAQARLARAERQAERLRQAAGGGAATATEIDEWETEARVARADVQLAQAQAIQAELDLSYTTITSPIAGVIGQSEKDAGSYVQTGEQSLLATVQQIDPIYVEYSVSEQEILRWQQMIDTGQVRVPETTSLPFTIELADGSNYPSTGRINFFSVQISPTTGTALARGEIANPEKRLRPGQLVHVHIGGIDRLNAITVPQSAVMQSPTGSFVYVVNADGLAQQRQVQLGEWVGDSWVITAGLYDGDRVIFDRLMMLRPDTPVRAVTSELPTAPAQPPATQRSGDTDGRQP